MKKHWNILSNKWMMSLIVCLIATIGYGQREVSGVLTDNAGSPLIGATVIVPGTATGTITDVDGSFSLDVPQDATELQVSYTGYESMMLDITNQSRFESLALAEATELLDEVVVIGYGRQEKSVVTGAIGSVKVEELATRGPGQIQSNIQGKVAGIAITPTSGAPDAGFKVKIRGTGSNGPTEPLYIVDGMRTADIRFLEGSSIASLEVLKDAASASIYGAEGANGVILISTKNGTDNDGISYSANYGVQQYRGDMELMSSSQLADYFTRAGVADSIVSNIDQNTNTDWIDELFVNAPTTRHNLSFSKGNDKTSIFLGAGYFNQDGILGGGDISNFRRLSANLGLNSQVSDRISINANFTYANEQSRGTGFGDVNIGGTIASAILMDPSVPVTYDGALPDHVIAIQNAAAGTQLAADDNGNIYGLSNDVTTGEILNPYIYLNLINGDGTKSNRMFGSVSGTLNLLEGLDVTTRVGTDLTFGTFHNWSPSYYANPTRQATAASSVFNNFNNVGVQWENFLTYNKSVSSAVDLDLLAGTSIYQFTSSGLNANASGLFSELQEFSYIDGSESSTEVIGFNNRSRLQSIFGRAVLTISDRYILMGSLRRDGTSLITNDRYKVYPGLSAGWIVSREGFFGQGGALNFMKVRASWGQAGSLSSIGQGAGLASLGFAGLYNGVATADPNSLPNPALTWETSEQTDIGVDLGFFNDKVTFSVDWFNKLTRDLLTPGAAADFNGNNNPLVNAGTIRNRGFEFELGYRNSVNNLKYQVFANLTTLDNEVTELANGSILQGNGTVGTNWNATAFQLGQPAWYYRGLQSDGLNEDGTPIFVDVNEDGEITTDDYTYIGDPHPGVLYGATIRLEYNAFDFTLFGQGVHGNEILMGVNRIDRPGNRSTVFLEDDFFAPATSGDAYFSDFMVFDGSFFRIKQIQLGYDLGSIIPGFNNLRIYGSIEDYFTFSSYPGLDPEIGSNSDSAQGIDRGTYPIPGRIMGGISMNF